MPINLEAQYTYFHNLLIDFYTHREIDIFWTWGCQFFHQLTRLDFILQKNNFYLTEKDQEKWNDLLKALKNHQPIQYYFNTAFFYDLSFYVDQNVLIPRPETEELVEKIIHYSQKNKVNKILDLGTGSGCIAITLAKHLKAEISACDLSEKALEIAKKNAENLKLKVDFFQFDILTESLTDSYDILVSNPPYIPTSDRENMLKNVLAYEPHQALFVPNDQALIFYEKILHLGMKHLRQGGKIFFEIHEHYGQALLNLAKKYHFKGEIHQDLQQKDRIAVLYAENNN